MLAAGGKQIGKQSVCCGIEPSRQIGVDDGAMRDAVGRVVDASLWFDRELLEARRLSSDALGSGSPRSPCAAASRARPAGVGSRSLEVTPAGAVP